MLMIREVLRLKRMGLNNTQISNSCNCARNTVIDIIKRAESAALQWPLPDDIDDNTLNERLYPAQVTPPTQKPDPDYEYIHQQLKLPNVTLSLLWAEYKDKDPDGLGYSQYCERYSRWAKKTKAVMTLEHKPGDKIFVDWTGDCAQVIDRETGEVRKAYLFIAVLGHSQLSLCGGILFSKPGILDTSSCQCI